MILLTGASGFLGRKVVEVLAKCRIPFRCFGRTPVGECFIEGDISRRCDVERAVKDVDVVIHMAAPFSSVKKVNFSVIVEGTRNLVEACRRAGVERFVFVSSWAAARKNKDCYGRAKLEAERILEDSGLEYSIIRPSLIYGRGGAVFEQILKTTDLPFVPIIGSGRFLVGPVFVEDVAKIVVREGLSVGCRKYSVVGPLVRYDDFVKSCLGVLGKDRPLVRIPYFVCWLFASTFGMLVGFPPSTLRRSVEGVYHGEDHFSNFFDFELTPLDEGLRKSIVC